MSDKLSREKQKEANRKAMPVTASIVDYFKKLFGETPREYENKELNKKEVTNK